MRSSKAHEKKGVKSKPLVLKALGGSGTELEKDEALEFLWWLKQVVGMILGVILGYIPVEGWIGFAIYGIFQYAIAYSWAIKRGVLGTCLDLSELLTGSLLIGAGMFFLAWTITFTCTESR